MKKFFWLVLPAILLFSSCKKEMTGETAPLSEQAIISPPEPAAAYKIILTGQWMAPAHTVPAGNHFTKFTGMVHNNGSYIFHPGIPASLSVENVAEVGNDAVLLTEIDNYITAGTALNKFSLVLPTILSTDSAFIHLTAQHSLISFESMIAPSPDWFAGLDSYNLIQNGKWVKEITISIFGYDAGTEDGDVFGYNNPASSPQQNIGFMTTANASVIANGNPNVAPFATLHLIKQ